MFLGERMDCVENSGTKKIRKSLANEFIYNQSFDMIYKWPKKGN